MITRNIKGKLSFSNLDFEIMIDEIISVCKTEEELDWVEMQMTMAIEKCIEEDKEEL